MKLPFRLPWAHAPERTRLAEQKALNLRPGAALALLSGEAAAHWSGRSYAALSSEGFMKNPVAHRRFG